MSQDNLHFVGRARDENDAVGRKTLSLSPCQLLFQRPIRGDQHSPQAVTRYAALLESEMC